MKWDTIKILKRMNSNYPEYTSDYDEIFLNHLIKAVYTKQEMMNASKKHPPFGLNEQRFQFLKGKMRTFS